MRLSLHQLTALDAIPSVLVGIAQSLGVQSVCLFTHVPEAAAGRFPAVLDDDIPLMRRMLGDSGVTVSNLEVFPLDRNGPRNDLDAGLAIGAALGATRATAHLHAIGSEQEGIDRFAAFAEQAARHDIIAGLEYNPFSATTNAAAAERIVRGAGAGSIVLDVLHTVRGGSSVSEVEQILDLISYAQLSDGPSHMPHENRWREAVGERLLPGEGDFQLIELLKPLNHDVIFDIEVPQSSARKSGVPAIERARRAVEASRRLLENIRQEHAR